MKVVWHFENEEHKKEWQGKLLDMLAEDAINIYPKEIDAAIELRKAGLLNL